MTEVTVIIKNKFSAPIRSPRRFKVGDRVRVTTDNFRGRIFDLGVTHTIQRESRYGHADWELCNHGHITEDYLVLWSRGGRP